MSLIRDDIEHSRLADEILAAVGIDTAIERYDEVLSMLEVLEIRYDADKDPSMIRYIGDGDTAAPYFRDVLTKDAEANIVKVEHFYNAPDDTTPTAKTEITYNSEGNPLTSKYTET